MRTKPALTIDQLKKLVDARDLKYFVAPDKPMLLLAFGGLFGHYQVVMNIELDGSFLMIRTVGYDMCPKSHAHCNEVAQLLGSMNFLMRTTKFSWDPNDGEITASIELWLEDAKVTDKQFEALLHTFLPAIDLGHHRIQAVMETGLDPGFDLSGFTPTLPEPSKPRDSSPVDSPVSI